MRLIATCSASVVLALSPNPSRPFKSAATRSGRVRTVLEPYRDSRRERSTQRYKLVSDDLDLSDAPLSDATLEERLSDGTVEEAVQVVDEDESYDTMWRKRRIDTLKTERELDHVTIERFFEPDHLQKKLYARSPESQYGAVFKVEGVVADIDVVPTFWSAWCVVATENELALPERDDVAHVINSGMRHEVAIERVFRWSNDWAEARRLSARYKEVVATTSMDELEMAPREGVTAWLESLALEGVPCAAYSRLPAAMLGSCLERTGLAPFFGTRVVCAEDDRESADQALLHAAVSLERQPSRCLVFSDNVEDIVQAHEVTMRCVGVMSPQAYAYELRVADTVVAEMSELRIANIRRVFSDVDYDPAQVQLQREVETVRKRPRTIVKERERDPSTATSTSGAGGRSTGGGNRRRRGMSSA